MTAPEPGMPRQARQISELFALVGLLGHADGIGTTSPALNAIPGCWERVVDERWTVIVNGHPETLTHRVRDSKVGGRGHLLEVPPYHVAIIFNGWPAGQVNAYDGVMAGGEAANEDALISALKRALGHDDDWELEGL